MPPTARLPMAERSAVASGRVESAEPETGPPMHADEKDSWVVYRMTLPGKVVGVNAVCSQREWDAMELARPGYHTLLQAGIASEGDAEKLARQPPIVG